MNIYFLVFEVSPRDIGPQTDGLRSTKAYCWSRNSGKIGALLSSRFRIEKGGWEITGLAEEPILVSLQDFKGKDLGEKYFKEAERLGISICFLGVNENADPTLDEPLQLPSKKDLDFGVLHRKKKEVAIENCLFYAKSDCNQIINAHSIQKSRALSSIAVDGEVYVPNSNMTSLKKRGGLLGYTKQNITSVSTFRGFCQKHDNEVFEDIDNFDFSFSPKQAFLYAYRILCKEFHTKKNALATLEAMLGQTQLTASTRSLLSGHLKGTSIAIKNMERHKSVFDETHRSEKFDDIRHITFVSKSPPSIVFSGCLFPDFGFDGRFIQDFADTEKSKDLITFSYTPLEEGWGFLFAWHRDSDLSCQQLIGSLAAAMADNSDPGSLLLGMIIKCCENSAISPRWLEGLSEAERDDLEEAISSAANSFEPIESNYLSQPLLPSSHWEFDSIKDFTK